MLQKIGGKNNIKKKCFISSIIIVSLLLIVGALQLTNFSDLSNSGNITFTGNQNHTKNLTIYRYANVTSATINLSGYDDNWNKTYEFKSQDDSGNTFNQENLTGDGNISTYAFSSTSADLCTFSGAYHCGAFLSNYTIPDITHSNGTYRILVDIYFNCPSANDPMRIWDLGWSSSSYDSGNYQDLIVLESEMSQCDDLGTGNHIRTFGINQSISNNLRVLIGGSIYQSGSTSFALRVQDIRIRFYNETSGWGNYSINPNVTINNTNIWSYSGTFNHLNNQSTDFSSTINTALNSGNCDCVGCSLNGNNCTIPVTFHSDTEGIIKYSDININWLEHISPNVTINQPTGTKTTIDNLQYNITTQEDWERDTCIYWITRGASTEIANNTLTCSDEITGTFSVSTDRANYVYHFWINDTSGNTNYTNSSFYIEVPSGSPSGEGGGGSSTVVIGGEKGWIMQVADGVEKFEIEMAKGQKRKLEIQFENTGETQREIRLSCEDIEGEVCEYITFSENPFTLPATKDIKTRIPFEINLPEEINEDDYVFNIKATDDNFVSGSISVYLGVGKAGIFILTLSKLREGIYLLIFSGVFIFSTFILAFALPKKFPIKPFFVIIFSMTLAFLGIYFT